MYENGMEEFNRLCSRKCTEMKLGRCKSNQWGVWEWCWRVFTICSTKCTRCQWKIFMSMC